MLIMDLYITLNLRNVGRIVVNLNICSQRVVINVILVFKDGNSSKEIVKRFVMDSSKFLLMIIKLVNVLLVTITIKIQRIVG